MNQIIDIVNDVKEITAVKIGINNVIDWDEYRPEVEDEVVDFNSVPTSFENLFGSIENIISSVEKDLENIKNIMSNCYRFNISTNNIKEKLNNAITYFSYYKVDLASEAIMEVDLNGEVYPMEIDEDFPEDSYFTYSALYYKGELLSDENKNIKLFNQWCKIMNELYEEISLVNTEIIKEKSQIKAYYEKAKLF